MPTHHAGGPDDSGGPGSSGGPTLPPDALPPDALPPVDVPPVVAPRPRERRDRHGRGMRTPLAPPPVPLSRTRRQGFEDLVADAFDEVAEGADALGLALEVVVVVTDVPPPGRVDHVGDLPVVPLGDLRQVEDVEPADPETSGLAEIVLYRRPIEARSLDDQELADLVRDVVVELTADLLGVEPGELSPGYDED